MKPTLEHLIHGYFDDTLSDAEASELNALIKSDSAAADKFAEIALLHQSLEDGFQSGNIATRFPSFKVNSAPFWPRLKPMLPWGLAAAAGIIALIAFNNSPPEPTPSPVAEKEELHDTGFAVLTRVVDAKWSGDNSPTKGDFLTEGALELSRGLVQIEFLSGVSLVVEGDAAFDIISPDEMRLVRGKLRAHVPEHAIGFQIHTTRGTALDLGTEFALDLTEDNCELHVIDGEVEWHAKDEKEILLTGGKGLRLSDDKPAAIQAEPTRFTSPGDLARKVANHQDSRFQSWLSHSAELTKRSDVVAYFPMTKLQPWSRSLTPAREEFGPGSIVAAEQVEGRWPDKKALDFSPNGSRVRVTVPGEFQKLTFSTWAKIDSLDRQYNGLFLTDNYDEGKPHWQITEEGRLFFSIKLPGNTFHHINLSPVIWDHSTSQRWIHLVTTYDVPTRTCTHYLNGDLISQEQAPKEKQLNALTIGNAQIGNWGLPTKNEPEFAVRNLNGRLDEFTIFSSELTSDEVKSLYENGKP